jgi:hypothetical protein
MIDYTGVCCVVNRHRVQILVDAVDLPRVGNRWRRSVLNRTGAGDYAYAVRRTRGRVELLHRVVTDCAGGMVVDHINGDRLDNRRANLRVCTHRNNMRNRVRHVNSSTGFKGVVRVPSGKFVAHIKGDDGLLHLGTFATPEQAHAAYRDAAVRLHGEFARFA